MNRNEWTALFSRRLWPVLSVVAIAVLMSGCTIGGKGGKSSHENPAQPAVTPNTVVKLPENLSEVSLDVTNGAFGSSEIVVQQQGASMIHIVNHDKTAYQFQIVPNLVTAKTVAANATTDISFTSPDAGIFTGQLLPQAGGGALATVSVRVQSAGGVNP